MRFGLSIIRKGKKWKFKKFIKLCAEKCWLILNELNKEYLTMYAKSRFLKKREKYSTLKVCTTVNGI